VYNCLTSDYDGQKLFTRRTGRLLATPLFVVLILIETTDVVFAVDSVPAILAERTASVMAVLFPFETSIWRSIPLRLRCRNCIAKLRELTRLRSGMRVRYSRETMTASTRRSNGAAAARPGPRARRRDRLQAQAIADRLRHIGLVLDHQHTHALDATSPRISRAYRKRRPIVVGGILATTCPL
jgi:hypothetical protein